MILSGTDKTLDRLVLRGQLSDVAQLPGWVENLGSRHDIPVKIQFAINLCLEEVVSNIIMHGYSGEADRVVNVSFTMPKPASFVFTVEDEAPRFNPLEAPELPPLSPRNPTRTGGQGIRLLRQFASALEYEPTSNGNRLKMSFSTADSAA